MSFPIPVSLTVDIDRAIPIVVSNSNVTVSVGLATPVVVSTIPDYDGEYDITPSDVTQAFQTNGKKVTHDFIVEPIPSNYGRIAWNGTALTVY